MAIHDDPSLLLVLVELPTWLREGLVIAIGTLLFFAPFVMLVLVSQPDRRQPAARRAPTTSPGRVLLPLVALLAFLLTAAFGFW